MQRGLGQCNVQMQNVRLWEITQRWSRGWSFEESRLSACIKYETWKDETKFYTIDVGSKISSVFELFHGKNVSAKR